MMIDQDTRDYYFDLLMSASRETMQDILAQQFGRLEGMSYVDQEPLTKFFESVQRQTDIDFGI